MSKKRKGIINIHAGRKTIDDIKLAFAFVGENKQLFKEWIESKGGKVLDDSESEDSVC